MIRGGLPGSSADSDSAALVMPIHAAGLGNFDHLALLGRLD
jgi:hypothetical protein